MGLLATFLPICNKGQRLYELTKIINTNAFLETYQLLFRYWTNMLVSSKSMGNNACTRVPTVLLENWKRKMHFNFQFSNSKKNENWNSASNFNFRSPRKTIFQFSQKVKIEIRMPIFISFNFSIPKSVPVRYFQSCKSEKALNEQRPEDSALKLNCLQGSLHRYLF